MIVIKGQNAHTLLPEVLRALQIHGERRNSRNGLVLKFPVPTTIVYNHPTERVVFWPERDANPFFHLVEAMWMLAGRRDVDTVQRLVKRMGSFSDDGWVFNGAYGHRWRHWFGVDQLLTIAEALKKNPDCRRQVLGMWDPRHDLGLQSRDLPCNTQAYFQVNAGKLDMMVTNRSNDIVWGALGANAVHFSFLQEWMSAAIGVAVGRYWQTSMNMHMYLAQHESLMNLLAEMSMDPLEPSFPASYPDTVPLVKNSASLFLSELGMYLDTGTLMNLTEPFIRKVLHPMRQAHDAMKTLKGKDRYETALFHLGNCKAEDWRLAASAWVQRRWTKYEIAVDRGVNYED